MHVNRFYVEINLIHHHHHHVGTVDPHLFALQFFASTPPLKTIRLPFSVSLREAV